MMMALMKCLGVLSADWDPGLLLLLFSDDVLNLSH